jgi:hypothetical protein
VAPTSCEAGRTRAVCLGDLACRCIGRIALMLPSEGGRTHMGLAFRSSSPGSDEGGDEGGVGTRCVEVGSGRQRRWAGATTSASPAPAPTLAVAPAAPAPAWRREAAAPLGALGAVAGGLCSRVVGKRGGTVEVCGRGRRGGRKRNPSLIPCWTL